MIFKQLRLHCIADSNLLANTTVLDWRIFNNVSKLYNIINNLTLHFNDSLFKQSQIIQRQQDLINNLTQQINCSSNQGYQTVNGSCVQVSCAISGQQTINGICQCTNINAIVVDGSCVCPVNSILIGTACICSISGQTIQNNQCVCKTLGAVVENNICTCVGNSQNISDACTCPTNSSLLNEICTCDIIVGQQMINGTCQCPSGQTVVENSCTQTSYVINISNIECSQEIFTTNFDIQTVTHLVSTLGNFSAGFVFSVVTNIENAFIYVSDNIYTTTVSPLFQSQNIFKNIKLQFGIQTLNSGSFILSSSSSLSINQMSIISKLGTQLMVNPAQLNILASTAAGVNVTNLLVNLSFALSSGNITLINNINNLITISGYQVLGSIVTTGTVAMIGINLNSAVVNVNQVSIQLSAFHIGNGSSYLFGNAVTSLNTINIYNFAVILGSSSNVQLLSSVSSNSTNYYKFGGIVTNLNSASIIIINNVIFDSYQKISSSFISYSGFLIGHVYSNTNNVTLQNICMQQSVKPSVPDTITQFNYFGLIGWNSGNLSITRTSVVFFMQTTAQVNYLGIIGRQTTSLYAEINNLRVSSSYSSSAGQNVGYIFGLEQAKNCSIQNSTVERCNSSSVSNKVGGICGYFVENVTILNSTISDTNVSGSTYIGGFVGYCQATMFLINSKIQFARLSGTNYVGIVVGLDYHGVYSFSVSKSVQNYINGILKTDCAVISNTSEVGC
ncbi:Conserved_hypothetical protein [Hexamita inflata]|uniref:Uncharacterized protein n=1 Tax=Hexamita inflata TaxID=28002 RepID=A0AA86PS40_9EUKA|nr:Conserved hypothetical protein [Hexamita inflata]CAI9940054.1 Conserved hypothetical protein [Hexamita inflata]